MELNALWMLTLPEIGNSVEGSDPVSVLSCLGFRITYAKRPLYWSSKLQTEIALSTTEIEYIEILQ